jgi:hypothetical protein
MTLHAGRLGHRQMCGWQAHSKSALFDPYTGATSSSKRGAHMQIKRHNMSGSRVFATDGPNVEFEISDSGQANVAITLRLSDGTLIHYPTGLGQTELSSSLIAPGEYGAVVTVSAVAFEFGRMYDARILIGGKKAISAKGSIPDGQPAEMELDLFVVRVNRGDQ